jgi:hypothetical protein
LKQGDTIIAPVSVTADIFENTLIEKVLPDIAFQFPAEMLAHKFRIPLENATPHKVDQIKFNNNCEELGIWN